jgi:hypothetical protein
MPYKSPDALNFLNLPEGFLVSLPCFFENQQAYPFFALKF